MNYFGTFACDFENVNNEFNNHSNNEILEMKLCIIINCEN